MNSEYGPYGTDRDLQKALSDLDSLYGRDRTIPHLLLELVLSHLRTFYRTFVYTLYVLISLWILHKMGMTFSL